MFGLGPELIIIALIVIVLFGAKRIPELGDGFGKAISNFRKSYRDAEAIDVTPKEDGTDASDSADASK